MDPSTNELLANDSEASNSNSDATAYDNSRNGKLGINVSEFICYTLFKIWYTPHHSSPKACKPQMPILKSLPKLNKSVCESVVSPANTEDWFPELVARVEELMINANTSTPIIFISLLYISRLRTMLQYTNEEYNPTTLYQLFVLALLTASKSFLDNRVTNKKWDFAGIELSEINQLERLFIVDMRWDFHVRNSDYEKWIEILGNIGREHMVIAKAVRMAEKSVNELEKKLSKRPDLIKEIWSIRNIRKEKYGEVVVGSDCESVASWARN